MSLDERRVTEGAKPSHGLSYVPAWLPLLAVVVGCVRGPSVLAPADGGQRDAQGASEAYDRVERGGTDDSGADDVLVADAASDFPMGIDSNVSRKPRGTACSDGSECASGFCADGVCCQSSCKQVCQTCSAPFSLGVCTAVPDGVSPSRKTDCPASAPSTCGLDGTCDGKGACRLYVDGTTCQTPSCLDVDGLSGVSASVCDGTGRCIGGAPLSCSPFKCDPSAGTCFISCTNSAQCSDGKTCTRGICGTIPRMPCVHNADCESGFCSNGACCDRACDGPCESCLLAGSVGKCTRVDDGTPDPNGICQPP